MMEGILNEFDLHLKIFNQLEETYTLRGGVKIVSPIEKAFLGFWFLRWGENAIMEGGSIINPNIRDSDYVKKLVPQYKLELKGSKRIIVDFVLFCNIASKLDLKENLIAKEECEILYNPNLQQKEFRIAVELDGHRHHERLKEQVIKRDRRDMELQKRNYTISHISGSQIYNNFKRTFFDLGDLIIGVAANERDLL